MRQVPAHKPYSYREDASVPEFDDAHVLAVMDGNCALCSFGARLISRFDRQDRVKIAPAQSKTGGAVMRHYGLDPDDPDSWLVVRDGKAVTSLDAMIEMGWIVGGPGWLLQPLRLLTAALKHWLYQRIARNRYALFGRTDLCALPDPKLRARLIE